MEVFHSQGKLLITGEYVVLDGAVALAVPTKFGQTLEIGPDPELRIHWKSLDKNGASWFDQVYSLKEVTSDHEPNSYSGPAGRILQLLRTAAQMNPNILHTGKKVISKLEFPGDWGLGSSSTLVANIAKWFGIDPYKLLSRTFGGSGYDIAVAMLGKPITFELTEAGPGVLSTGFLPEFKDNLFFVHLNRKQNSRESIQHYQQKIQGSKSEAIEKISSLTHRIISCQDLTEFELLLEIHENIISGLVGLPKIKSSHFPDYTGAIKSLGGWGGDFILATGGPASMDYFRNKGYTTILTYEQMVL